MITKESGIVLVAIAVAGVLLVLASSWVPSSRAVAVAPVEALRAAWCGPQGRDAQALLRPRIG